MGPAGLPRDVVESLNAALGRVLAAPEVLDRLRAAGAEATPSSPEALAQRYADWVERFGRIARSAGVVPQ